MFSKFILPIIIAIITYTIVDRLGEWKKRRQFSKLGIAIINSILEEIGHGISQLETFLKDFKTSNPINKIIGLPNQSWSGMDTISDDVLLRIIEISDNYNPKPYHPKNIRIHCKNYFKHISNNVMIEINRAVKITKSMRLLTDDEYKGFSKVVKVYIKNSKDVQTMLNDTVKLLDKNSSKIIPK